MKLHVLLDHDVYMPRFMDLSEARDHDITHLDTMPIPAEPVVAMDLGYTDYDLYNRWTKERIWFVTRMKSNAAYEVVAQRPIPKNRSILSDEVMRTSRARLSRTPGSLRVGRFRTYGNQAATIFLRSWERSQTVYSAMCSRGFTGEFPLTSDLRLGAGDLLFVVLVPAMFVAGRLLA